MKIKSERIKTIGAVLGLVGLFAGGVLVPYHYRDASLNKRIDAARATLGIGEVDNAGLVRLYDEVQSLRDELSGGQHIPTEAETSTVLQDLSGLINAPGVTGQEIVTLKSGFYADYNILPVKIQFDAPFATAFDLVKRIERLSSVVRVDRIEAQSQADYPSQPLTVNLELSAFFMSDPNGGAR
jgi:hypothetical protein